MYGEQAACSSADASGLAPNAVVADAVQDSRQTVRKTDVDEDEESDEKESRHDHFGSCMLYCWVCLLSILKIMTEVMATSSQIVNGAKSVMVKLHGSLVKSPKKDDKAIISLIVLLDWANQREA